eukprot:5248872-Pyramimonas_sp.AAC.1
MARQQWPRWHQVGNIMIMCEKGAHQASSCATADHLEHRSSSSFYEGYALIACLLKVIRKEQLVFGSSLRIK